MQINSFSAFRYDTLLRSQTAGNTAGTEQASDAKPTAAEQARSFWEQAIPLTAHSTTLTKEWYRISVGGEKVAPEDRINLEGVTAEYLANMSDEDYVDALERESNRYANASIELIHKGMDLDDPSGKAERDAKLSGRPSLTSQDEAQSVLASYTDMLTGLISSRNTLHKAMQSDRMKDYLVTRFGEDGAKAQMAQMQEDIDGQDKQIDTTVQSLNVIFNMTGMQPIATLQDGVWSMNAFSGIYSGGSFVYSFKVSENGTITGK